MTGRQAPGYAIKADMGKHNWKPDWEHDTGEANPNRRQTTVKTNAAKSYLGVKDACACEHALTLTKLLVVMPTLAILAALILSALPRFTNQRRDAVNLFSLVQYPEACFGFAGVENEGWKVNISTSSTMCLC